MPKETITTDELYGGSHLVNSKKLIEMLDEYYPDIFPDPNMNHINIAYLGGQVSVVRHIKQLLRGDPE